MYKSKNHSKFSLKAHLILVVKYRKEILIPPSSPYVKQKFQQIADKSNFNIKIMETDKDHIHLLIDYESEVSIFQVVRRLKQESAFALWK